MPCVMHERRDYHLHGGRRGGGVQSDGDVEEIAESLRFEKKSDSEGNQVEYHKVTRKTELTCV